MDSALIGLAIQNGFLTDSDQTIYELLPEFHQLDWSNGKDQLTLKDLMTMRSGMACHDGTQGVCNSKIINQQNSWASYTLQQSITNQRGIDFSYFSGLPVLSHTIVENATNMSLDYFAEQYLFLPLGITSFSWTHSPSGEALSGYMLPRDMAKFGQLYLDDGMWHGQQIINSAWIAESLTEHVAAPNADSRGYGYWWWLDKISSNNDSNTQYQYYAAFGAHDQFIFIFPELEMVVVLTGNKDDGGAFQILENFILPAIN